MRDVVLLCVDCVDVLMDGFGGVHLMDTLFHGVYLCVQCRGSDRVMVCMPYFIGRTWWADGGV